MGREAQTSGMELWRYKSVVPVSRHQACLETTNNCTHDTRDRATRGFFHTSKKEVAWLINYCGDGRYKVTQRNLGSDLVVAQAGTYRRSRIEHWSCNQHINLITQYNVLTSAKKITVLYQDSNCLTHCSLVPCCTQNSKASHRHVLDILLWHKDRNVQKGDRQTLFRPAISSFKGSSFASLPTQNYPCQKWTTDIEFPILRVCLHWRVWGSLEHV